MASKNAAPAGMLTPAQTSGSGRDAGPGNLRPTGVFRRSPVGPKNTSLVLAKRNYELMGYCFNEQKLAWVPLNKRLLLEGFEKPLEDLLVKEAVKQIVALTGNSSKRGQIKFLVEGSPQIRKALDDMMHEELEVVEMCFPAWTGPLKWKVSISREIFDTFDPDNLLVETVRDTMENVLLMKEPNEVINNVYIFSPTLYFIKKLKDVIKEVLRPFDLYLLYNFPVNKFGDLLGDLKETMLTEMGGSYDKEKEEAMELQLKDLRAAFALRAAKNLASSSATSNEAAGTSNAASGTSNAATALRGSDQVQPHDRASTHSQEGAVSRRIPALTYTAATSSSTSDVLPIQTAYPQPNTKKVVQYFIDNCKSLDMGLYQLYQLQFNSNQVNGTVSATKLTQYFGSGPPIHQAKLWSLANTSVNGELDFEKFCITRLLIDFHKSEGHLPRKLPPYVVLPSLVSVVPTKTVPQNRRVPVSATITTSTLTVTATPPSVPVNTSTAPATTTQNQTKRRRQATQMSSNSDSTSTPVNTMSVTPRVTTVTAPLKKNKGKKITKKVVAVDRGSTSTPAVPILPPQTPTCYSTTLLNTLLKLSPVCILIQLAPLMKLDERTKSWGASYCDCCDLLQLVLERARMSGQHVEEVANIKYQIAAQFLSSISKADACRRHILFHKMIAGDVEDETFAPPVFQGGWPIRSKAGPTSTENAGIMCCFDDSNFATTVSYQPLPNIVDYVIEKQRLQKQKKQHAKLQRRV